MNMLLGDQHVTRVLVFKVKCKTKLGKALCN